jgi:pimeloyl-ACP methyl ester carboxylesterase
VSAQVENRASLASDLETLRSKECLSLETDDGLTLWLRRYKPKGKRKKVVVLIHGATASSDTFLLPAGGLVHYLTARDFEVWTLDWRGSCLVTLPKDPIGGSIAEECKHFSVDRVVAEDYPKALDRVQQILQGEGAHGSVPLSVVAHCFGAGSFAIAIARNTVDRRGVDSVVLSTLGLFYETPFDGWVKVEDFIIERILGQNPPHREIDPRKPDAWPPAMTEAYDDWPRAWLPFECGAGEMFRRLTFMFGQPYLRERLVPGIHKALLPRLFGGMHLGLYLHAGQMVRRGYAAPLDAIDLIDRARLALCTAKPPSEKGDLIHRHFADKRMTLITGAQNRLWHRDSIDLMYEWLLNGPNAHRPTKKVFSNYAHQDLLWSDKSESEVYPHIESGLE